MRTLLLAVWLVWAVAAPAVPPEVDVEAEVQKVARKLEQDQHKLSNPRYFQQLDRQLTNKPGLELIMERYTHGSQGEGFLIVFFWNDGQTEKVKVLNFGPATYLEHTWR